ncbi:precorrin-2 C(20)-methyltransferase [Alkaliphilus pronyensis]|uniref:Precorrin-2 C(20)-methyltransferase n=1 Tax=Alkaliphilus pronyensis TaxID=1482732 RepID=A0A6I0FA69_9FIRM|nr:precorrin-2 C(20)-methyltransferase [Alkaliphilus pronyensis]KAB3539055.1 precorrin-2 C(20)-methyltransferase [Alkaliphilus pronyensis]
MGKFYGIGVGPGDPELITIKAIKAIQNVDIIICPEAKKDKGSIALKIAKQHIKEDAQILYLTFPMIHNKEVLKEQWKKNSTIIKNELEKGKNIGFITLGDPMVFSTYIYLLRHLKEEAIEIETIPGITAFCAVASRVNVPLSVGEETLGILPLMKDCGNLEKILEDYDNVVIMKASHDSPKMADILEKKGYKDKFVFVSKCSTNEEEISYDIERLRKEKVHYLSTIIVKRNKL